MTAGYKRAVTNDEDVPPSVGDFVWWDQNSNGIQDAEESGVPNITVQLLNANDTGRTGGVHELIAAD